MALATPPKRGGRPARGDHVRARRVVANFAQTATTGHHVSPGTPSPTLAKRSDAGASGRASHKGTRVSCHGKASCGGQHRDKRTRKSTSLSISCKHHHGVVPPRRGKFCTYNARHGHCGGADKNIVQCHHRHPEAAHKWTVKSIKYLTCGEAPGHTLVRRVRVHARRPRDPDKFPCRSSLGRAMQGSAWSPPAHVRSPPAPRI